MSSNATSSPRQDWARPVTRSIEEFLDAVIAVTEAGLWVGGDSYGLMPPEPRVYPPPGMPLAYVAWTSQDYGMISQPERRTVVPDPPEGAEVLSGSYVDILGFEPPDRLSAPEGLTVVHDGYGIHPPDDEV